MPKRKLAIWLAWKNFSEYYSQQLALAISEFYDTTITYQPLNWDEFDVVMPFFPQRNPGCEPRKVIKCLWEPWEFGWARDAGLVLAASTSVYDRIKTIYSEKAHLVPWGVNPEHFSHRVFPGREQFIVGWAGNYDNPRKQFEKLEATLRKLDFVTFRPSKCYMVSGEQKGPYESVAVMADYYAGIHLYVCGSASEGFGFPLLEAAACGRPIVTFDVGIARDLLNSGVKVFIAEDWEDLQKKVMGVYSYSEAMLKTIGRHNATVMENAWTWKWIRPIWLSVLAKAE